MDPLLMGKILHQFTMGPMGLFKQCCTSQALVLSINRTVYDLCGCVRTAKAAPLQAQHCLGGCVLLVVVVGHLEAQILT